MGELSSEKTSSSGNGAAAGALTSSGSTVLTIGIDSGSSGSLSLTLRKVRSGITSCGAGSVDISAAASSIDSKPPNLAGVSWAAHDTNRH